MQNQYEKKLEEDLKEMMVGVESDSDEDCNGDMSPEDLAKVYGLEMKYWPKLKHHVPETDAGRTCGSGGAEKKDERTVIDPCQDSEAAFQGILDEAARNNLDDALDAEISEGGAVFVAAHRHRG